MMRKTVILIGLFFVATLRAQDVPADPEPWWVSFEQPELQRLIQEALENNPEPSQALARMRAADFAKGEISTRRRPSLNLQAAYRTGRENTMRTGFATEDMDPLAAQARLSWELDVFNRIEQDVTAGEAAVESAFQTLRAVELALSLDVADAWFKFLFYQQQTEIYLQQLISAAEIVDRIERKVNSGLTHATELNHARARQEQHMHLYMGSDTRKDIARADLVNLIGGDVVIPDSLSLKDIELPGVPFTFSPEGELKRPDIARAWAEVLAARAESKSANRSRLPSLSLVVSAAGERDLSGDSEEGSAWIGPVLDIPIWSPDRKYKSKRKKAEAEAALAEFERVSLQAVREMNSAWAVRSRADAMALHMKDRYRNLKEIADRQERKLKRGLVSEIEHLQSQIEAQQAEIGMLLWQLEARQAHVQLIRAFGGALPKDELDRN